LKKKIIFGLGISTIFLYLSVRQIEFAEVWKAFASAEYFWALPTIAIVLFTMWLRAWRWHYLLRRMKSIGSPSLFSSVMIGFMSNNILPARLGELVRAISIAKKESISRSGAFATIMVERIFDSFAILFIMAICMILFPFPELIKKAGYITFLINVAALVVLFSLSRWTEATRALIEKVVNIFPAKISVFLMHLLDRFIEGLGIFKDIKSTIIVCGYTALLWVIVALSSYPIFLAFGIKPSLIATFVLLVIVAFAVMLPSSPGFIGTFQYGCTVALGLFDIPKEISFPFSVVLWSCQFFPVTLLGLYYLRRESLSLKAIDKETVA